MALPNDPITEAYKNVIDFNKTVISISSAVLAGQIAYLVFQKADFLALNFVSSGVLTFSIFFCLASFGRAIKSVKDSQSRPSTLLLANLGAILLILGIFCLLLIKTQSQKSLDEITKEIEATSFLKSKGVVSKEFTNLSFKDNLYTFEYKHDTLNIQVAYSIVEYKIVSYNQSIIQKPITPTEQLIKNKKAKK